MRRINFLITGACGYIGSNLCKYINETIPDATILACDNLLHKQEHTKQFLQHNYNNIIFYRQDVTKYTPEFIQAVKSADFIIPLAAIVGAPACDRSPEEAIKINYEWYERLLTICTNQKILYPNTNSGYGTTPKDTLCTEETQPNPISLYGKLKQSTEDLLLTKYKENSICFRLATVFGISPRARLDLLVNNFVYRAFKDKEIEIFDSSFRRNFISVGDVCRAFLHGINNFEDMKGTVYNLGTDSLNATKLEFAQKISEITGCKITVSENKTDPDKRDYLVCNKKLYDTGFDPIDKTLDKEVHNIWKFLSDNGDKNLDYAFNY